MDRLLINGLAFAALAGGAFLIGGELFAPKPLCRQNDAALLAQFKEARAKGEERRFQDSAMQVLARRLLNGKDREGIESTLGAADGWSKGQNAEAGVYLCGALTFEARVDGKFVLGMIRRGDEILTSGHP